MKVNISKEWIKQKAEREDSCESVECGVPPEHQRLRMAILHDLGWRKDYPCSDEYDRDDIAWRAPNGSGPWGDSYLPDLTNDFAMELIERLEKKGWIVTTTNCSGIGWHCRFENVNDGGHHWARGPSQAIAVAMAYAKVKGIEI